MLTKESAIRSVKGDICIFDHHAILNYSCITPLSEKKDIGPLYAFPVKDRKDRYLMTILKRGETIVTTDTLSNWRTVEARTMEELTRKAVDFYFAVYCN